MLLQALKDGECTWVTMSSLEVSQLVQELKAREKKERAPRKDKGGTHAKGGKRKRRDENDDPAVATKQPAKRARGRRKESSKSQLPPMARPQSRAEEESSSENEVV